MSGAQVGRKHVLTPEEMKKVIRLYSVELMTQTAIAKRFQVSQSVVRDVLTRENVKNRAGNCIPCDRHSGLSRELRRRYPKENIFRFEGSARCDKARRVPHVGCRPVHNLPHAGSILPAIRSAKSEGQSNFEGWAVVELFGHQREVGFVTTPRGSGPNSPIPKNCGLAKDSIP